MGCDKDCRKDCHKCKKRCKRVDNNFYSVDGKFSGECSRKSLPIPPSTDGVHLLVKEWAQLFVSDNSTWVTVPQTETYVFLCVEEESFWEVHPDKFSKNIIDVFCAKKFDKLLDCGNDTLYTLTKDKCGLRWVKDCTLAIEPFPMYVNGTSAGILLPFDTLVTVEFDTIILVNGWTLDTPGVWIVNNGGTYKVDYSINLRSISSPEGVDENVEISTQYYVNDLPVGIPLDQGVYVSGVSGVQRPSETMSGSAILALTASDKLKLMCKRLDVDNQSVINVIPAKSTMTGLRIKEE
uniref:Uncharacterized protein n=1 Tax=Pithovirus LCPAC403 TaxID=2506596 RepID=A0A481ZCJ9_9VIRU|nr:MAG: uncharacterized protein LCPAC403_01960 [Pithovirus LCPAC403]